MGRFLASIMLAVLFCFGFTVFAQEADSTVSSSHQFAMLGGSAFLSTDNFNAGSEARIVDVAFMTETSFVEVGPAISFATGSDSLGFVSLGIKFLWEFTPDFYLAGTPSYAFAQVGPNTETWFNVGFDLGAFVMQDRGYVGAGFQLVDGSPFIAVRFGGVIK